MNCQDLNSIEGLKFIPINGKKIPTVKRWQVSEEVHNLADCIAVGLLCGKLSGYLEAIDIDCKYDLTGKLFENYKRLIHENDKDLLQKLVVQKTRNGGYHLVYRCSAISGNLKLANRPSTDEERMETYNREYKDALTKNPDDATARLAADKASKNDKVKVLIETRGEGGYIACFPSDGYELIHGDYYGINDIMPEQRELLHGIARQFNQVFEEIIVPKKSNIPKISGLSSFDDYNNRGDIVALLQGHGWKIVGQKGNKTVFLRPGQTTSQSSGNYDHEKNWFSVFTTSSEFEPQHAYLPYAVYAVLECNKNYSEASKKLYELGYGDRQEAVKEKAASTRVITSRINIDDDDLSFLAKPEDYDEYLKQVRDGTLPQGITTGMPSLDEYFLFKEGNMVMTNGHDGSGKSIIVWYLALISAMYHGWNWIIFASENTLGGVMRKLIQFYWGKQLTGKFAMNDSEFKIAKKFIEEHFSLIKSEENMYNYKDIINMVKKALKQKKYHATMIDPYNGLKIDLSGFSKLSTHEYHYEALSDLKQFGIANRHGIWINHHAVTASLRAKDGEKKYPIAPQKADTEGGGKVGNKTDEFITIHRLAQHPSDWMITELHVRKVKDYDTGGRPTPIDSPIKLEAYKGGCAFKERLDTGGESNDPIANWHNKSKPTQQLLPMTHPTWTPYADDKDEVNF